MRPLLVAVALLATLWSPVAAQNYVFGPNVRVNDDTLGRTDHWTISPGGHYMAARGDSVYLVWYDYRTLDAHIYFARSTDAGRTFQPSVRIDDTPSGCTGAVPSLALDDSGRIHVSWLNFNAGRGSFPYYARSTDGGRTFSSPIRACDSFASDQHGVSSIAVNRSGRLVYVARSERSYNPDSAARIMLARSTDGGTTFVRPDTRVSVDASAFYPSVAVFDDTIVLVAWHQNSASHAWDVHFARSMDGGASFESSFLLNDTVGNMEYQGYPSVGVDNLGRVFVVYSNGTLGPDYLLGLAASTDTGRTFLHEVGIPRTTSGFWTSLQARGDGQLYLAYDAGVGPNVYFTSSTDGGATFSRPVYPCDVLRVVSTGIPAAAVNGDGRVFVAWADARNDPQQLFYYDVYLATGTMSAIEEKRCAFTPPDNCTVTPDPAFGPVEIGCSTGAAGDVAVVVCDLVGRQVAELGVRYLPAGRHRVTWDGRDRQGRRVGGGVYFVMVQSVSGTVCRRFQYISQ